MAAIDRDPIEHEHCGDRMGNRRPHGGGQAIAVALPGRVEQDIDRGAARLDPGALVERGLDLIVSRLSNGGVANRFADATDRRP